MFGRALSMRKQGMFARDIAEKLGTEFGCSVKKRSMQTMFSQYRAVEGIEAALRNWDEKHKSEQEKKAGRSRGGKAQWEGKTEEERSREMSRRATRGWAEKTKEQRSAIAEKRFNAMPAGKRKAFQEAGTAAARAKDLARSKQERSEQRRRARRTLAAKDPDFAKRRYDSMPEESKQASLTSMWETRRRKAAEKRKLTNLMFSDAIARQQERTMVDFGYNPITGEIIGKRPRPGNAIDSQVVREAIKRESIQRLRAAIRTLPAKHRRVATYLLDGAMKPDLTVDFDEISSRMAISRKEARTLVDQTFRHLRERVGDKKRRGSRSSFK